MAQHNPNAKKKVPEYLRNEYETPDKYFDPLNALFKFDVDAAATANNALLPRYWTKHDNGLEQSWAGLSVFCNPPYTKGQYAQWVQKACNARYSDPASPLHVAAPHIALVLPFNPETKGFSPVWYYADYLLLPYERIKFGLSMLEEAPTSPNFYSCIALFTDKTITSELHSIGRLIRLSDVEM